MSETSPLGAPKHPDGQRRPFPAMAGQLAHSQAFEDADPSDVLRQYGHDLSTYFRDHKIDTEWLATALSLDWIELDQFCRGEQTLAEDRIRTLLFVLKTHSVSTQRVLAAIDHLRRDLSPAPPAAPEPTSPAASSPAPSSGSQARLVPDAVLRTSTLRQILATELLPPDLWYPEYLTLMAQMPDVKWSISQLMNKARSRNALPTPVEIVLGEELATGNPAYTSEPVNRPPSARFCDTVEAVKADVFVAPAGTTTKTATIELCHLAGGEVVALLHEFPDRIQVISAPSKVAALQQVFDNALDASKDWPEHLALWGGATPRKQPASTTTPAGGAAEPRASQPSPRHPAVSDKRRAAQLLQDGLPVFNFDTYNSFGDFCTAFGDYCVTEHVPANTLARIVGVDGSALYNIKAGRPPGTEILAAVTGGIGGTEAEIAMVEALAAPLRAERSKKASQARWTSRKANAANRPQPDPVAEARARVKVMEPARYEEFDEFRAAVVGHWQRCELGVQDLQNLTGVSRRTWGPFPTNPVPPQRTKVLTALFDLFGIREPEDRAHILQLAREGRAAHSARQSGDDGGDSAPRRGIR